MKWKLLIRVQLFETPWNSPQYSGLLEWVAIPFPGGFPNSRIEPGSPELQVDSLPAEVPGKTAVRFN